MNARAWDLRKNPATNPDLCPARNAHHSKLDLIPILLQVAQSSPKEKVLRIVLATFRNLITQAPQQNLPALLAAGVLPFIVSLQGRKFGDEDLVEDLQLCTEELKERKKSLS